MKLTSHIKLTALFSAFLIIASSNYFVVVGKTPQQNNSEIPKNVEKEDDPSKKKDTSVIAYGDNVLGEKIYFTEAQAKQTALLLTSYYRSSLLRTTKYYLNHFFGVTDSKSLKKIFTYGSGDALHVTRLYGSNKAEIISLTNNDEVVIADRKPSEYNSFENAIIEELNGGEQLAIRADASHYYVGVKLFNDLDNVGSTKNKKKTIKYGCASCHSLIMDGFDIEKEHLSGLVYFIFLIDKNV